MDHVTALALPLCVKFGRENLRLPEIVQRTPGSDPHATGAIGAYHLEWSDWSHFSASFHALTNSSTSVTYRPSDGPLSMFVAREARKRSARASPPS